MNQGMPRQIRRPKLLVVDHDPALLDATLRVLRSAGLEVIEADNVSSAIALIDRDIGLVVFDVDLPGIDRSEVCRRLRACSGADYLPIVQLSATTIDAGAWQLGAAAGADCLLRPGDPVALIAAIGTMLFARDAIIARRAADSRFRCVFDLASSGIVLLDREFHCQDANPAFCVLAGSERRGIIGRSLASLIAPAEAARVEGVRSELEQRGHWEGKLSVVRGDDSVADVEWRIGGEAEAGARIAIATDISERRSAEVEREQLLSNERVARAEAERSNRLKDEFLAMLSHELRNPLNAILGWAKVLGRVPGNTPLIVQGIDAIERNSRLQSHLITDLLDFAGIQSGKLRVDLGVVDPAASVQAALDAVAPQALAKGVRIESYIADRGARVLGDASRLQQVVWNLLANAIKFTPDGGRIDVSAQVCSDFYQIEVADTGQGISREFLPRIFDRFSQQESGAAKSFAGLGIGLTIVRHLVEAHGGSIEASSAGEGTGASFRVRLPLTREQPRAGEVTQSATLSGIHVLVVEDDRDARALVARLLNDAGAFVSEAAGADEAVARVAQSVPHVLVSDIGMARRDGYQLMRVLRAAGHSAECLPAIALTAFTRAEDRREAIQAGFQIHLTKPVDAEALNAAVARLGRPLAPADRLQNRTD
jgi:PAS domain S-box-containing protein